jgi:predicted Zn-dependent protease
MPRRLASLRVLMCLVVQVHSRLFHHTFKDLVAWVQALTLAPGHFLILNVDAEASDYVRINRGRVRQSGQVCTVKLGMVLLHQRADGSTAQVRLSLGASTDKEHNLALCDAALQQLQAVLPGANADPLALFEVSTLQSEHMVDHGLPDVDTLCETILNASQGDVDLVGFLALGPRARGLVNTWGAQHYQSKVSYFFDFSIYAGGLQFPKRAEIRDKAVKQCVSDHRWHPQQLTEVIRQAITQAALLLNAPRVLQPGQYRAWLAPAAVADLLEMMCWGGFSLASLKRGMSPLEKAFSLDANVAPLFSPLLNLSDEPALAGVPRFQEQGFVGPDQLALIKAGRITGPLVSPRSGREFGQAHLGYDESETPRAFHLGAGLIDEREAMRALGTGLYISNLWYLNFSDRSSARVTGMTRFASLWVENGVAVTPLAAMRLDDSLYRIFGDQLEALGSTVHAIANVSTYDQRGFGCTFAPGALLRALTLTL